MTRQSPVRLHELFLRELARTSSLPIREAHVRDAIAVQFSLVPSAELEDELLIVLRHAIAQCPAGASARELGRCAFHELHQRLRQVRFSGPPGVATTLWLLFSSGFGSIQEVFEGYFSGDNAHFLPQGDLPRREPA